MTPDEARRLADDIGKACDRESGDTHWEDPLTCPTCLAAAIIRIAAAERAAGLREAVEACQFELDGTPAEWDEAEQAISACMNAIEALAEAERSKP